MASSRIRVLRCSIAGPWIALSHGGQPDYVSEFAEVLQAVIRQNGP